MLENDYKELLAKVINDGYLRKNRTDTQAYSLFDQSLKWDLQIGFPLLTSKFVDFKIIETEFEWFLKGYTSTKLFADRGIKIWDAWANKDGELGPVYGYQMLSFNGNKACNQLEGLIAGLQIAPFNRRHIITLWNPLQIEQMALPPCYLYFQFYVGSNNSLSLLVVQRSGDLFVGIPYDMGLFSCFLIYVASKVNMEPRVISLKIVDCHIYENHIIGVEQYLYAKQHPLPKWTLQNEKLILSQYEHEARIKTKIAI